MLPHALAEPSPWLTRHAHLLRTGGTVLDVACGSGRHVRWLAARRHRVTALDRDAEVLRPLQPLAEVVVADIEAGPWPLPGRCFDLVLVTNYLHRPLWPHLLAGVAEDGLLVYETFAQGNETVGRPSRPDFLLRPGELLAEVQGLRVLAYEDGFAIAPARYLQRVVAVREPAGPQASPPRYPLGPVAAGG
jgi:SAM-dependent methyltransferase